jgi:hypothetical protein
MSAPDPAVAHPALPSAAQLAALMRAIRGRMST